MQLPCCAPCPHAVEAAGREIIGAAHDRRHEEAGGGRVRAAALLVAVVIRAEVVAELVRGDQRVQPDVARLGQADRVLFVAQRAEVRDADRAAVQVAIGEQVRDALRVQIRRALAQVRELAQQALRIGRRRQLIVVGIWDRQRADADLDRQLRAVDAVDVVQAREDRVARSFSLP